MRRIKRAAFAVTDGAYRAKNRDRPRVLVYTDSRGENLVSRLGKTGYGTYANRLRAKYNLTYALCPEKYTTIVDFLIFLGNHAPSDYDAIVMHCGIVDFSPRPLSSIAKVRASKIGVPRFDELFTLNAAYYDDPFACEYYGEPTINIYSPDFLATHVLPELVALPQLIWINANRFVPGWEGNYTRGRPANIDETVGRFDAVMESDLTSVVDLKNWSPDQVQRLTIDNIHFTRIGFDHLFTLIDRAIEGVLARAPGFTSQTPPVARVSG